MSNYYLDISITIRLFSNEFIHKFPIVAFIVHTSCSPVICFLTVSAKYLTFSSSTNYRFKWLLSSFVVTGYCYQLFELRTSIHFEPQVKFKSKKSISSSNYQRNTFCNVTRCIKRLTPKVLHSAWSKWNIFDDVSSGPVLTPNSSLISEKARRQVFSINNIRCLFSLRLDCY